MQKIYNGSLTREQFLFYETRITAQLVCQGLPRDEIIERIKSENLFQFRSRNAPKQGQRG